MGLVHDVHFVATFRGGGVHGALTQIARVVHAPVRGGVELDDVEVRGAGPDPGAGIALAARLTRRRAGRTAPLAVQRHREDAGGGGLAHAAGTREPENRDRRTGVNRRTGQGQSAMPGGGCFATVTLRSRRCPDATITRLVEPSSRGSTRTRVPEASVPTNAMRSTPRSPGAAWRPVTGAALANPSCPVTRSTTTPRGSNAHRAPK